MYGTNIINHSLSFTKIINNLSKGLTIANQMIPIYQKTKPILSNAKKILNTLNEIKNTNNNVLDIVPNKKTSTTRSSSVSNPVFFQ